MVDASRNVVRAGTTVVPLDGRPVLFALARALAEASPEDVSRETLIARAFRARDADESHRARLRVEIGRLRKTLRPLAAPIVSVSSWASSAAPSDRRGDDRADIQNRQRASPFDDRRELRYLE